MPYQNPYIHAAQSFVARGSAAHLISQWGWFERNFQIFVDSNDRDVASVLSRLVRINLRISSILDYTRCLWGN